MGTSSSLPSPDLSVVMVPNALVQAASEYTV